MRDNLSPVNVGLSEQYIQYNLQGEPFLAGDMFRFYSSPPQDSPCFSPDVKGTTDIKFYNLRYDGTPFFGPIWFGYLIGVKGITSQTGWNNYLHFCYTNTAEIKLGPVPYRFENYISNMESYTIIINNVTNPVN